ncbi:RNA polymerase sigma factor [Maricaulis virginensis]|uniref:RNA polymerase sigma factor n=1 Tax=Maricaulis virginensis TaxID=144022 RepID=A0A9W6MP85_9PROT|nr:RNA polymerase sigma factor [Maricaulis virginensis]GLK53380.1 RNA polymerase sigma factor [Maricaulis virginensis]
MQTPDDGALVAAARSGSDQAFARIVDRYQSPVRGFLRRVSGNDADADEIAQDAFVDAWTHLRSLRDGTKLKSWLFAIAWRKAKARARSMSRSRTRETAWQALQPVSDEPQREMALAMQQALGQLPEEQRAAVALCLAGGWSHSDAASVLDLPLGTVKSHVSRGRTRLIAILGVVDA